MAFDFPIEAQKQSEQCRDTEARQQIPVEPMYHDRIIEFHLDANATITRMVAIRHDKSSGLLPHIDAA